MSLMKQASSLTYALQLKVYSATMTGRQLVKPLVNVLLFSFQVQQKTEKISMNRCKRFSGSVVGLPMLANAV